MLQTCTLEVPVSIQSLDTRSTDVFAGVSEMHMQMPRHCLLTRNDHNKQQNKITEIFFFWGGEGT